MRKIKRTKAELRAIKARNVARGAVLRECRGPLTQIEAAQIGGCSWRVFRAYETGDRNCPDWRYADLQMKLVRKNSTREE